MPAGVAALSLSSAAGGMAHRRAPSVVNVNKNTSWLDHPGRAPLHQQALPIAFCA